MNKIKGYSCLVFITLLLGMSWSAMAAQKSDTEEIFNPGDMINHHIMDGYTWDIAHGVAIPLPVILYSQTTGLDVFLSSRFYDENHETIPYKNYQLDHGHIVSTQGEKIWDFSITKNVLFILIDVTLMLVLFLMVARGYVKNKGRAPKGIQGFFEVIILFIRDEVVKPNIGAKYERYLPYMLTLFFFIFFGNILGLLPSAANMTGNIAITMTLAVFTLLLTNFSGNKNYWGHIFKTPGVPLPLLPIIVPVEIIGVFTKPISLMIRLFVAITAGHIVMLSLLSLIFIFQSWAVGIGTTVIVTFITFIEILVAAIQAYVFTMFSSLYIGMAVEEHH